MRTELACQGDARRIGIGRDDTGGAGGAQDLHSKPTGPDHYRGRSLNQFGQHPPDRVV